MRNSSTPLSLSRTNSKIELPSVLQKSTSIMESLRPSMRLVTARMEGSIEVKDRRINLRMYRRTFVAREAAQWLVDSSTCPDTDAAINMCLKMVDEGYIQSITRGKKHGFEANKDFYKFCVDLKPRRFTAVDTDAPVGDLDEDDDNSVPMMLNPLRTHGASNDAITAAVDLPECESADVRGHEEIREQMSHTAPASFLDEREVTRLVLKAMQAGETTPKRLRIALTPVLTADGFDDWKSLIKNLCDKYAGQVQPLLRKLDNQDSKLASLHQTIRDNDVLLNWFDELARQLSARLKVALDTAQLWENPPATYALLEQQAQMSVQRRVTVRDRGVQNSASRNSFFQLQDSYEA
eukprot:m.135635 g.135635  ORF g.135635 m.135635 type:complete len:351 (+) comp17561_c0_seq1:389-1441(+)